MSSIVQFYHVFLDHVCLYGAEGCSFDQIEEQVEQHLGVSKNKHAMNYVWKMIQDCGHFQFYFVAKPYQTHCIQTLNSDYFHVRKEYGGDSIRVIVKENHRLYVLLGPDLIYHKLTPKNMLILETVAKAKESGITQAMITKVLKIDPRSMFSFLQRLESLGVVFRIYSKVSGSHTLNCKLIRYFRVDPGSTENEETGKDEKTREAVIWTKPQIVEYLGNCSNGVAFREEMVISLEEKGLDRQIVRNAIEELVRENRVERVWYQDEGGLKLCVRLVSEKERKKIVAESVMDRPEIKAHALRYYMPIKSQMVNLVRSASNHGITMSEIHRLIPVSRKYIEFLMPELCKHELIRVPEFFGKERRFRYFSQEYAQQSIESNPEPLVAESGGSHYRSKSTTRDAREKIILDILEKERFVKVDRELCERILEEQKRLVEDANRRISSDTTRMQTIPYAPDVKTVIRISLWMEEDHLLRIISTEIVSKWEGNRNIRRILVHKNIDPDDPDLLRFVQEVNSGAAEKAKPKPKQKIIEDTVVVARKEKMPGRRKVDKSETLPGKTHGFLRSRMSRLFIFHRFLFQKLGSNTTEDQVEIPISKVFFNKISLLDYFQIFGVSGTTRLLDKTLIETPAILDEEVGNLNEDLQRELQHNKNAAWNYKRKIMFYLEDLISLGIVVPCEPEEDGFRRMYMRLNVSNPSSGESMRLDDMETLMVYWIDLEMTWSKSNEFHVKVVDALGAVPLPLMNVIQYRKVWYNEPSISFYFVTYMLRDCAIERGNASDQGNREDVFFNDVEFFLRMAEKYDQSFGRMYWFWETYSDLLTNDHNQDGERYRPEFRSKYVIGDNRVENLSAKDVLFLLGYMLTGHVYSCGRVDLVYVYYLQSVFSTFFDEKYLQQVETCEDVVRHFNRIMPKKFGMYVSKIVYDEISGNAMNVQSRERKARDLVLVEHGVDILTRCFRTVQQEYYFESGDELIDNDQIRREMRIAERTARTTLVEKLGQKQSIGSSFRRRYLVYRDVDQDMYRTQLDDVGTEARCGGNTRLYQLVKMLLFPRNKVSGVLAQRHLEEYDVEDVERTIEELRENGVVSRVKNPLKSRSTRILPGRQVMLSERYMDGICYEEENIDPKYKENVGMDVDVDCLGKGMIMSETQMNGLITDMLTGRVVLDPRFEAIKPGTFPDCKLVSRSPYSAEGKYSGTRMAKRISRIERTLSGDKTRSKKDVVEEKRQQSVWIDVSQSLEECLEGKSVWEIKEWFPKIEDKDMWEMLDRHVELGKCIKVNGWRYVHAKYIQCWRVPVFVETKEGWQVGSWVDPFIWMDVKGGRTIEDVKQSCMKIVLDFVMTHPGVSLFVMSVRFQHVFSFWEQSHLLDELERDGKIYREVVSVMDGKRMGERAISRMGMTCYYPVMDLN